MNPSKLIARLQAKSQHGANHLSALTPYERSLVLHEAKSIRDERAAKCSSESKNLETDNEATKIATTTAWIGQKLHDLPPESRAERVNLIDGLSNNARLERLMGDF